MQTIGIRPGMAVGDYELVRALGHGASATVYEALHLKRGRRVALKLLHGGPAAAGFGGRATARFEREARVAARVHHPHVVDVLDYGQVDGVPFLAMELVEGETLAQLLLREGKLSLARAVGILLPIASALARLHAAGIVHRDIKPSNILLAEAGAKLSDFGVSCLRDGSPSATQSKDSLGSPAYMAPEVVLFSATAATSLSDQYSLAATLYESTTGRRPFEGASPYRAMHAVVSAAVPPPSSVEPSLPKAFDDVVMRALSKEPEARFATIEQLARELDPFVVQKRTLDLHRPRRVSVTANAVPTDQKGGFWKPAPSAATASATRGSPEVEAEQFASRVSLDPHEQATIVRNLVSFPSEVRCRGLFFEGLARAVAGAVGEVAAAKLGQDAGVLQRTVPFRFYPHSDFYRLYYRAAKMLEPGQPISMGMRRTARTFFPIFRNSILGRTMTALMGEQPSTILPLLAKAYNISVQSNSHEARVVGVRDVVWTAEVEPVEWYADTLTGIIEGTMPGHSSVHLSMEGSSRAGTLRRYQFRIRW